MTVEVTQVYLLNVANGIMEAAELWHGITEQNLADWEGHWQPELKRAIEQLEEEGIEQTHWPQSRHWNWRKKVEVLRGKLANPGFSIICDSLTQGIMIVNTVKHRARFEGQRGQHLVYIEFVENAPWNRADLFNPSRYRGVGSILIRAAVELSEQLEFHGRIGLHSLPQANGFYAHTCGMADLGADPHYQDLCYFEMTPELAQAFIAKGNSKS